jgi:hypothetical protein
MGRVPVLVRNNIVFTFSFIHEFFFICKASRSGLIINNYIDIGTEVFGIYIYIYVYYIYFLLYICITETDYKYHKNVGVILLNHSREDVQSMYTYKNM